MEIAIYFMPDPKLLVTVGTTEFDLLLRHTDSDQFISLLAECGISSQNVLFQTGLMGKYLPTHSKYFQVSPDILQIYEDHDIIITHGGAGTILACLKTPHKRIICVANSSLAGNHQTELIDKLSGEGYLLGFSSVEEMAKERTKLKSFLRGELPTRAFEQCSTSVLNKLVYNQ